MNIIITAGGSREPIDDVRVLTNLATGRLSELCAQAFGTQEEIDKIYYLYGSIQHLPQGKKIVPIPVYSAKSLLETFERLKDADIGIVIHAMAVGDYGYKGLLRKEDFYQLVGKTLCREDLDSLFEEAACRHEAKISSDINEPLLLLERTPKVLAQLRGLYPQSVLVGFKLLSKVSEEELSDVAIKQLQKCHTDYVLANDAARIQGDAHEAFLMDKDGHKIYYHSKQEIALGLLAETMKRRHS